MFTRSLMDLASRLRPGRKRRAKQMERARRLIEQTELFDSQWYLERYPDVARSGQDPLEHFILHGGAEGRSPGPRFDARWYLRRNADVARSGANALLHYLEHGRHEGRSIKVLTPGSEKIEPEQSAGEGKAGDAATAQPYASEYDTRWQARPLQWEPLLKQLEAANNPQPEAPVDCAPILSSLAAGGNGARIELFLATAADAKPGQAACWQDVAQLGLGLEVVGDAWFAHTQQLLVRYPPSFSGADQVCAYQYGADGVLYQISAQKWLVDGGLLRLNLENPLSQVLLVLLAVDGSCVHSALIAFPSLYRGGLHHSEMLAVEARGGRVRRVEEYMAELAATLFAADRLLLQSVAVNLRGANGSEPIFQPALVASLRQHFGVELVGDGQASGSALVAQRLVSSSSDLAFTSRRAGGARLKLPADCIPSLATICSGSQGHRIGAGSFCIVPEDGLGGALLACLPQPNPALALIEHPALPLAQPMLLDGSGEAQSSTVSGLPNAVRFMKQRAWQVDTLLPLSSDIARPRLERGYPGPAMFDVVINHRGSPADLELCLHAIASQTEVQISEVTVLSGHPELIIPTIDGLTIQIGTRLQGNDCSNPADRSEVTAVLVDSSIFPHDPRTFAVLADICSIEGIGAATCPVALSSPNEGVEERLSTAWIADCTGEAVVTAEPAQVKLLPAGTFAVALVDPRIIALNPQVWHAFRSLMPSLQNLTAYSGALAEVCADNGLHMVATSLVRVATGRTEPDLAGMPAKLALAFEADGIGERAAHIVRLMS